MENTIQKAVACGAVYPFYGPKAQPPHFTNKVRWYFVLDFESTCCKDQSDTMLPEIIEFPVVVMDSVDGRIVDSFRRYVRPTENPILSDFCTKLTGIHQDSVKKADDLSVVLKEFDLWLKQKKEQLSCRFKPTDAATAIFVTWTDWDIGTCLWNECRRKKLPLPNDLLNRIDMKAIFQQWLGSSQAKQRWHGGLSDALRLVGLTFEGRPHCGIDDARNTALLLRYLLLKNIFVNI
ncbi:hypothetical protein T265_01488 [Opisthorchis viverrini]|uniref:Exonuclease domain-containing protein n=1 Tax=Opisthorchis viverrini TaxID=6198 RepID=A0A074ZY97_OPIVI|nr:hypothetical protein T265_01488 [Opisthorchis viverrini]KER32433.1 hypothetical protein T265_01488 [Opisthorchis viverrini]